jgi:hypothetical protein
MGASLNEAQRERILANRVADRRGHYFGHRGGGNSEPFALAHERKRGVGDRFPAHDFNRGNSLFGKLHSGIRGELDVAERWRRVSQLHSAGCTSSSIRVGILIERERG